MPQFRITHSLPWTFMNQLPGPSIAPHQRLWFLVDLQHCFGRRGSVATFEVHPVEGIHGGILCVGTTGFGKSWVDEVARRCNTLQPFWGTIFGNIFNNFRGKKKVEVFGGISWVHTDLLFFVNHRSPWSPWQLLGWSSPSSDESPALMGPWRLQTKPKTWWKALAAAGTPSGFHSSGRWMGLTWIINWQSQQKRLPACELRSLDDSRCFIDAYCHTWMDIDI